jgi:hypothetical protein
MLVRNRHTPSTGAHSHIHSLTFGVMEDLEAGQEIFVEYGDHVRCCHGHEEAWIFIVCLDSAFILCQVV